MTPWRALCLFPLVLSPAIAAFEPNFGQTSTEYRFVLRRQGAGVFLARDHALFAAAGRRQVRMRWLGTSAPASWEPDGAASGTVHYYGARRIDHVPSYSRVVSRSLYPGIDLMFRDSAAGPEYDFVLHPGADPRRIRLAFDPPPAWEAGDLAFDHDAGRPPPSRRGQHHGDLAFDGLRHHTPALYQMDGRKIKPVHGVFVRRAGGEVGFQADSFDPGRALVIDPLITFSAVIEPAIDSATPAAADAAGNSYLAGTRVMVDPGRGIGGTPVTSMDGVLTKIAPDGKTVLFTTYIRNGPIASAGIGPDGIVVVAGTAFNAATGVEATAGAFQTVGGPGYVAKLAPGGAVAWVARLNARPAAAVSDPLGNLYVTGTARSDFLTTPGAFKTAIGPPRCSDRYGSVFFGCDDAFAARIHPDGKSLIYATFLGGSAEDSGTAIAADITGSAFVAGETVSEDFPVTPGAYRSKFGGRIHLGPLSFGDGFAARLDPLGRQLIYGTYLGSAGADTVTDAAVDSDQSAYFLGVWADPKRIPSRRGSPFVVKLNPRGEELWTANLDPKTPVTAGRIAIARAGRVVFSTTGPLAALLENRPAGLCEPDSAVISLDSSNGIVTGLQGLRAASAAVLAVDSPGGVVALARGLTLGTLLAARIDFAAETRLAVSCIVNSGSLQALPAVAPGELVTLRGTGLRQAAIRLGGAALPVFYSSPDQAGAMIPYDMPAGDAVLTVENQGLIAEYGTVRVGRIAPGVFTFNGSGSGAAAAVNEDGTFNSAGHPARRGSLVSFFATGFGPVTPPPALVAPLLPPFPLLDGPLAMYFSGAGPNGVGAVIEYAGLTAGQVSGLIQINARVPMEATPGKCLIHFVFGSEPTAPRTQAGVFLYVE